MPIVAPSTAKPASKPHKSSRGKKNRGKTLAARISSISKPPRVTSVNAVPLVSQILSGTVECATASFGSSRAFATVGETSGLYSFSSDVVTPCDTTGASFSADGTVCYAAGKLMTFNGQTLASLDLPHGSLTCFSDLDIYAVTPNKKLVLAVADKDYAVSEVTGVSVVAQPYVLNERVYVGFEVFSSTGELLQTLKAVTIPISSNIEYLPDTNHLVSGTTSIGPVSQTVDSFLRLSLGAQVASQFRFLSRCLEALRSDVSLSKMAIRLPIAGQTVAFRLDRSTFRIDSSKRSRRLFPISMKFGAVSKDGAFIVVPEGPKGKVIETSTGNVVLTVPRAIGTAFSHDSSQFIDSDGNIYDVSSWTVKESLGITGSFAFSAENALYCVPRVKGNTKVTSLRLTKENGKWVSEDFAPSCSSGAIPYVFSQCVAIGSRFYDYSATLLHAIPRAVIPLSPTLAYTQNRELRSTEGVIGTATRGDLRNIFRLIHMCSPVRAIGLCKPSDRLSLDRGATSLLVPCETGTLSLPLSLWTGETGTPVFISGPISPPQTKPVLDVSALNLLEDGGAALLRSGVVENCIEKCLRLVVSSTASLYAVIDGPQVTVVHSASGKTILASACTDVSFTRNMKLMALGDGRVVDLVTGALAASLPISGFVSFSADGNLLLASTQDGVSIYNCLSWAPITKKNSISAFGPIYLENSGFSINGHSYSLSTFEKIESNYTSPTPVSSMVCVLSSGERLEGLNPVFTALMGASRSMSARRGLLALLDSMEGCSLSDDGRIYLPGGASVQTIEFGVRPRKKAKAPEATPLNMPILPPRPVIGEGTDGLVKELVPCRSSEIRTFVLFCWPHTIAQSVSICASFSQWQPIELRRDPADGCFRVSLGLAPAVYYYYFVVDGEIRYRDDREQIEEDGRTVHNLTVRPPPLFAIGTVFPDFFQIAERREELLGALAGCSLAKYMLKRVKLPVSAYAVRCSEVRGIKALPTVINGDWLLIEHLPKLFYAIVQRSALSERDVLRMVYDELPHVFCVRWVASAADGSQAFLVFMVDEEAKDAGPFTVTPGLPTVSVSAEFTLSEVLPEKFMPMRSASQFEGISVGEPAAPTTLPLCSCPATCAVAFGTSQNALHIQQFRHVCPNPHPCAQAALDPVHCQRFDHPDLPLCPAGAACDQLDVMSHRVSHRHMGMRTIPSPCPAGPMCALRNDPNHLAEFAHWAWEVPRECISEPEPTEELHGHDVVRADAEYFAERLIPEVETAISKLGASLAPSFAVAMMSVRREIALISAISRLTVVGGLTQVVRVEGLILTLYRIITGKKSKVTANNVRASVLAQLAEIDASFAQTHIHQHAALNNNMPSPLITSIHRTITPDFPRRPYEKWPASVVATCRCWSELGSFAVIVEFLMRVLPSVDSAVNVVYVFDSMARVDYNAARYAALLQILELFPNITVELYTKEVPHTLAALTDRLHAYDAIVHAKRQRDFAELFVNQEAQRRGEPITDEAELSHLHETAGQYYAAYYSPLLISELGHNEAGMHEQGRIHREIGAGHALMMFSPPWDQPSFQYLDGTLIFPLYGPRSSTMCWLQVAPNAGGHFYDCRAHEEQMCYYHRTYRTCIFRTEVSSEERAAGFCPCYDCSVFFGILHNFRTATHAQDLDLSLWARKIVCRLDGDHLLRLDTPHVVRPE